MIRTLVILTFLLAFQSCLFEKSKIEVKDIHSSKKSTSIHAKILSVDVQNNQLYLGGSKLNEVKSLKITGPSNFEEQFEIESQSNSQIIANGLRNFNFAIGTVFSLVVSDAHGASTYQVSFDFQDDSVTAAKLHNMGAGVGDGKTNPSREYGVNLSRAINL